MKTKGKTRKLVPWKIEEIWLFDDCLDKGNCKKKANVRYNIYASFSLDRLPYSTKLPINHKIIAREVDTSKKKTNRLALLFDFQTRTAEFAVEPHEKSMPSLDRTEKRVRIPQPGSTLGSFVSVLLNISKSVHVVGGRSLSSFLTVIFLIPKRTPIPNNV